METGCDHKSVGVIIENERNEILLLDRAKYPFGLAAPAGHVDEHGNLEQTAVAEVKEEVGVIIPISSLRKIVDGRRIENRCRRQGGDYHEWTVYQAMVEGVPLQLNEEETRGAAWRSVADIEAIAHATYHLSGREPKLGEQVLERIWLEFFVEAGIIT